MKDKLYKYGFLSVCGIVFVALLYLAYHGAIDRSITFAEWIYHGYPLEDAKCALAFSESMEIME